MKQLFAAIWFLFFTYAAGAQDSSTVKKWQLSGFADLYYQYDFNQPLSNERPPFIYNHKKHNRPSLNLAVLKLSYNSKKLTGNLALMAGDYSRYNLAAEPRLLQRVYEANIGYRVTDKFSAEAGILPSHIGMESAISKDCWNLSRSLLAENSPYYETGVKLNYTFSPKWTASVLLLNGWQNIKENNRRKAVGTQVQIKPDDKWMISSSTFIGNEQPDSVAARLRVFHNFYATYVLTQKLNVAVLTDMGKEGTVNWWSAAGIFQYRWSAQWKATARGEYYSDAGSVIVKAYPLTGIQLQGYSLGVDFLPSKWIMMRSEAKYMNAEQAIFTRNGKQVPDGFSLLLSLSAWF